MNKILHDSIIICNTIDCRVKTTLFQLLPTYLWDLDETHRRPLGLNHCLHAEYVHLVSLCKTCTVVGGAQRIGALVFNELC